MLRSVYRVGRTASSPRGLPRRRTLLRRGCQRGYPSVVGVDHQPRLRVLRVEVFVPVGRTGAGVVLGRAADARRLPRRGLLPLLAQRGHLLLAEVGQALAGQFGGTLERRVVLVLVGVDALQIGISPRRSRCAPGRGAPLRACRLSRRRHGGQQDCSGSGQHHYRSAAERSVRQCHYCCGFGAFWPPWPPPAPCPRAPPAGPAPRPRKFACRRCVSVCT